MAELKKRKTNSGSFNKGRTPWNKGTKGIMEAWNKGKKCPQISRGLTGRKLSNEHRKKAIKNLMIPIKEMKQKGQFKKGNSPWNKYSIGVMPAPWNKLEVRIPYPYEFNNLLKLQIRRRDLFKCQLCNIEQKELNQKLIVHHIDFNKQNNSEDNLISLCRSCHGRINCANKRMWIDFFQNIQIKKLEVENGG